MAILKIETIASNSITVSATHNSTTTVNGYRFFQNGGGQGAGITSIASTTNASASWTFSNLAPSTAYSLAVHFYRNGVSQGSDTKSATTKAPPVPAALSNLVVTPKDYAPSTSVAATWNASSGATGYRWSTTASTSDGTTNGAVTGTNKSINVTSPAGGYQFTVTPYNSSGNGTGLTKSFSVVNPPEPSSLRNLIVSPSGYSPNTVVTITWDPSSPVTEYRWSTTASTFDGITNGAVTGTNKSIKVTSPAGAYQVTVTPYNGITPGTGLMKSFAVVARLEPYEWTYAGCGLSPPYNPILGKQKNQNLGFYATEKEWNDLIQRVLAVRTYKGLGPFSYNSAVSGQQPRAAQFNQVRNAIAAMNTTGLPGPKEAGDTITAKDFNDLVACLNAIQ